MRATADDHAELFWALRGGGGNFGVVTAMEFRLYPYAEVYAGMMLFPYERHAEVAARLARLDAHGARGGHHSIRIMHLPPLPELPPFLRGRSIVVIDGAYAGDAEAGAAALAAAARAGAGDGHVRAVPPAALSRIHMDPEEPMPFLGGGTLLDATDDETLAAFAAGVQPGAPLMFGELRHLGGAVGREPERAGALGSIPGEYLVFGGGAVMAPGDGARRRRRARGLPRPASPAGSTTACTSTSPRSRPTRSPSSARSVPPGCGRSARPSTPTASWSPTTPV